MTSDTPAVLDNSGVRIPPPAVYLAGLVGGYLIQWLWPIRIAAAPLAVWVACSDWRLSSSALFCRPPP